MRGRGCWVLLLVLLSFGSLAQDAVATLTGSFDRYRNQNLQEKLFVHTDRTLYLTGETMWFNILSVDGALHRPLELNRVAYVELLDKNSQPVLQTKVPLVDGSGGGSLFLPATLQSGHHRLMVYTNWMKNFGSEHYFHCDLTLVNPFLKLPPPAAINPEIRAAFFPEGGHLVNGLRSIVGFEVTDYQGNGIPARGYVIASSGDTVARFSTIHGGLGRFDLQPKQLTQYRATILAEGKTPTTMALPGAQPGGIVMNVMEAGNEVEVRISATPDQDGKPVILLAHTRQVIVQAVQKTISGGQLVFTLPLAKMRDGVTHITLFDQTLNPICQRLFFKAPNQKLNILLNTSQPEYGLRNRVRVTASAGSRSSSLLRMSMAVYRLDSLPVSSPVHILPYLLLTSDLKGRIDDPETYFAGTPEATAAADVLMLTHGWSRFNWQEVVHPTKVPAVVPEHHGHFISARITDRQGLPVKGIPAYLSFPSASGRVYSAVSDGTGRLQFEVHNLYSRKRVYLRLTARADSLYTVAFENPFSQAISEPDSRPLYLNTSYEQSLIDRSVAMQVQDIYHDDDINRRVTITEDTSSFFGMPDERYYLDDYTRFPLIEEVLREYVKGVWVRKADEQFKLKVVDKVNVRVFDEDPLILVDGVPVFNPNAIMEVDPLKVKRVDVMTRTFYLGPHALPGLLSFSTYEVDLAGIEIDPSTVTLDYEGLQLRQEFYSPVYETALQRESRIPDRRTLLYWNPKVVVPAAGSETIEFYTSDLKGEFIAVAEGITSGGNPGTGIAYFSVK